MDGWYEICSSQIMKTFQIWYINLYLSIPAIVFVFFVCVWQCSNYLWIVAFLRKTTQRGCSNYPWVELNSRNQLHEQKIRNTFAHSQPRNPVENVWDSVWKDSPFSCLPFTKAWLLIGQLTPSPGRTLSHTVRCIKEHVPAENNHKDRNIISHNMQYPKKYLNVSQNRQLASKYLQYHQWVFFWPMNDNVNQPEVGILSDFPMKTPEKMCPPEKRRFRMWIRSKIFCV